MFGQSSERVVIRHVSDSALPLVVPKGLVLDSEDPDFADMVIAHDGNVTLDPGETKALELVQLGASEWVVSHFLDAQLPECFALNQCVAVLFYHRIRCCICRLTCAAKH